MTDHVIDVRNLTKTFRHGFWRKRVEALKGVSFRVEPGSIFGFLGPNGAGKTTTIKILTGLIAPTGGEAIVLGKRVPSPAAMQGVGFLPENAYVYPYLTPLEFVMLCGRLSGLRGQDLRRKTSAALERTGIAYAADRPVVRLSKGMLQRTCLAAALVHEPKLLILDEPMSGLDPVGRKEVRDIIVEERAKGRTVFFSSHILSDVETLCDQVTILRRGEVVVEGNIEQLLHRDVMITDVLLYGEGDRADRFVSMLGDQANADVERRGDKIRVAARGDDSVSAVLKAAIDAQMRVAEVAPRRETLEDLFVARAFDTD